MVLEEKKLCVSCQCYSPDHIVRFQYCKYKMNDGSVDNDLCIDTQLCRNRSLWKRIITAIRYIFKRDGDVDSHWGGTLVSLEDAKEIQKLLQQFIIDNGFRV